MAEMAGQGAEEDKHLRDIFLEGWKGYEVLEKTTQPINSEFEDKVKTSMGQFETATRIVNDVGMFSANELIDEVSTESLRYLLLPYFLGKLALKLHNQQTRADVLNVAEIYFKDYLQRCQEYELTDEVKSESVKETQMQSVDEMKQLLSAAQNRNEKIVKYRQKKELEEYIQSMRNAVQNDTVDEETKREFFLKFLKMAIIDTNEELSSLRLEKQMVEMHMMHANAGPSTMASAHEQGRKSNSHAHGHHHNHHHPQHAHEPAKPKPLQPFIITRNAAQKSVFGLGYPSLPVMTVNEFYQQRVDEGIFPDEEKVAKMNAAQAIAAAADPNEKEDQEQAVEEVQVENDDPEYLARMRRMDEYKDVVRRGDGNRHNRS